MECVKSIDPEVSEGEFLHQLAGRVFHFNRSVTGSGVRQTLKEFSGLLPNLVIHEVPSGTAVLDWIVPQEWSIEAATLSDPTGRVVADWRDSNLSVVNYSQAVDLVLSLEELQSHLHSLPELPDAIPYMTSYYHENWGFCLRHEDRENLIDGNYHALIKSSHFNGSLTYGDCVIPGVSRDEVFISTYICHPSMANNELSGPMVALGLARWLSQQTNLHYTYRFVFAPETVGAMTYLSRHLEHLKKHVVAAFNLTCVGDDRAYSYLPSRNGNTRADRIARRVLHSRSPAIEYSFLERGSDERHYCAPGVDLPMVSLMRSRYGTYPEYHSSKDDLSVVTASGLQGGLDYVRDCVVALETEPCLFHTVLGEPQLGRRGLYHSVMGRTTPDDDFLRTHILAYADGAHSVEDLAFMLGEPPDRVRAFADELKAAGLLREAMATAVSDF